VGTRGSRLALAQAEWVISALKQIAPGAPIETVVVQTTGDASPVEGTGALGDGIFVKEIQAALLAGKVDLAVHSLKDMPTEPVPGLLIGAVPVREDPREAMVGGTLAGLAAGARVGTSSPRRSAQLRHARPDLQVVPMSGNVPTRIEKVRSGDYDAALLAAAGLNRLGLTADDLIDPAVLLPAPGQGALAADDEGLGALLAALHHPDTRAAVAAERWVLRQLGGGCLLPVAAYGQILGDRLVLTASVTSSDGKVQVVQAAEGGRDQTLPVAKIVVRGLLHQGAKDLLS